jgi:hypothetical protein
MKVTATREDATWRLSVGDASVGGFSLVSESPAAFRRIADGARQEVRTLDPIKEGKPLRVRDVQPDGLFPEPKPPAPKKRRRT